MSVDQKSTMTAAIGQSDKIETYMGKWKNNFSQISENSLNLNGESLI
jgi:hypothetical protein